MDLMPAPKKSNSTENSQKCGPEEITKLANAAKRAGKGNWAILSDALQYCPHCGTEVPPGAEFCMNCGSSLQPPSQAIPAKQSKTKFTPYEPPAQVPPSTQTKVSQFTIETTPAPTAPTAPKEPEPVLLYWIIVIVMAIFVLLIFAY